MTKKITRLEEHKLTNTRSIFWPIYKHELVKFIPLASMMFCILFIHALLHDLKDCITITSPGSGAETITFLKVYGVVPFSILFFLIYTKLSNHLSYFVLFHILIGFFILFFLAFAFLFYPNLEKLHISVEKIEALKTSYPHFQWLFPIYGNWASSLFYIIAELWGSIVLSLLFWQLANQITTTSEAKRFYGMFGLIGNFGLIASGIALRYFSRHTPQNFTACLQYSTTLIVGITLIMLFFYYSLHRLFKNKSLKTAYFQKASKMSFKGSLGYIFSSKSLWCILMLVICSGMSTNFLEITWKSQVKMLHSDTNDYAIFMSYHSTITGILTLLLMVIGSNILRKYGWFYAAIASPLLTLTAGSIFFGMVLFENQFSSFLSVFNMDMIYMTAWVGLIQNALNKASYYSLFSPTKEMAYIPLDPELKSKGKAAVDVVGARCGKAGGAFLQQILLLITAGTQSTIAPYLTIFLMVINVLWIRSVYTLDRILSDTHIKTNKSVPLKRNKNTQ